jgi:hypothetical protein
MNHRTNHTEYHPIPDAMNHVDGIQFHNIAHFNAEWTSIHPSIPPPDTTIPRLAERKQWEVKCPRCVQECKDSSERAERTAASVLAARRWSLQVVSFASFVTDKRVAPSEWEMSRCIEQSGTRVRVDKGAVQLDTYPPEARLLVYTKRADAPYSSRVPAPFRWSSTGWALE